MDNFPCCQCEFVSRSFLRLLNHYGYLHNGPQSMITCNVGGCKRLFRNARAFQVHVKLRHTAFWGRFAKLPQEIQDMQVQEELSESEEDDDLPHDPVQDNPVEVIVDTDSLSTTFILGLPLREKYKVNDQACSYVAEETQDLLRLAREQLQRKARNALPEVQEAELEEIFSLSEMEQSFSFIKNTANLNSYIKEHFDHVEPVEYVMGRKTNGQVQSTQYVSILETLQALLKDDDIFAQVIQGHQSEQFAKDYCGGLYCKGHPLFSQLSPSIQVILYNDDFTVANPIGNRAQVFCLLFFSGKSAATISVQVVLNSACFVMSIRDCFQIWVTKGYESYH